MEYILFSLITKRRKINLRTSLENYIKKKSIVIGMIGRMSSRNDVLMYLRITLFLFLTYLPFS